MTTTRRYHLRFTDGHAILCHACTSVLLMEGRLASAPDVEQLTVEGFESMRPASTLLDCDNCTSIRAFEAKRALLPAPPARLGKGMCLPHLPDVPCLTCCARQGSFLTD